MFRAPSHAGLPAFSTILGDIPATPRQIARHLDLSEGTIARYRAAEQAPRAVMLALFWESQWGRATADCEAVNWAALHHQAAVIAKRENAALRRQIEALEKQLAQVPGQAANAPFLVIGAS